MSSEGKEEKKEYVKAVSYTVQIAPFATRQYIKCDLNEIHIPEPYNLCVNLADNHINVFKYHEQRSTNNQKDILVPKEFADKCKAVATFQSEENKTELLAILVLNEKLDTKNNKNNVHL